MTTLWGACDALFTPRPLGPLHDIALQLPDDLAARLESEAPRATLFSALLRLPAVEAGDHRPSRTCTGPTRRRSTW
jgi:hypothetical protein